MLSVGVAASAPSVHVPRGFSSDAVAHLVVQVLQLKLFYCQSRKSRNILRKSLQILCASNEYAWASNSYRSSHTQTNISHGITQEPQQIANIEPTTNNLPPSTFVKPMSTDSQSNTNTVPTSLNEQPNRHPVTTSTNLQLGTEVGPKFTNLQQMELTSRLQDSAEVKLDFQLRRTNVMSTSTSSSNAGHENLTLKTVSSQTEVASVVDRAVQTRRSSLRHRKSSTDQIGTNQGTQTQGSSTSPDACKAVREPSPSPPQPDSTDRDLEIPVGVSQESSSSTKIKPGRRRWSDQDISDPMSPVKKLKSRRRTESDETVYMECQPNSTSGLGSMSDGEDWTKKSSRGPAIIPSEQVQPVEDPRVAKMVLRASLGSRRQGSSIYDNLVKNFLKDMFCTSETNVEETGPQSIGQYGLENDEDRVHRKQTQDRPYSPQREWEEMASARAIANPEPILLGSAWTNSPWMEERSPPSPESEEDMDTVNEEAPRPAVTVRIEISRLGIYKIVPKEKTNFEVGIAEDCSVLKENGVLRSHRKTIRRKQRKSKAKNKNSGSKKVKVTGGKDIVVQEEMPTERDVTLKNKIGKKRIKVTRGEDYLAQKSVPSEGYRTLTMDTVSYPKQVEFEKRYNHREIPGEDCNHSKTTSEFRRVKKTTGHESVKRESLTENPISDYINLNDVSSKSNLIIPECQEIENSLREEFAQDTFDVRTFSGSQVDAERTSEVIFDLKDSEDTTEVKSSYSLVHSGLRESGEKTEVETNSSLVQSDLQVIEKQTEEENTAYIQLTKNVTNIEIDKGLKRVETLETVDISSECNLVYGSDNNEPLHDILCEQLQETTLNPDDVKGEINIVEIDKTTRCQNIAVLTFNESSVDVSSKANTLAEDSSNVQSPEHVSRSIPYEIHRASKTTSDCVDAIDSELTKEDTKVSHHLIPEILLQDHILEPTEKAAEFERLAVEESNFCFVQDTSFLESAEVLIHSSSIEEQETEVSKPTTKIENITVENNSSIGQDFQSSEIKTDPIDQDFMSFQVKTDPIPDKPYEIQQEMDITIEYQEDGQYEKQEEIDMTVDCQKDNSINSEITCTDQNEIMLKSDLGNTESPEHSKMTSDCQEDLEMEVRIHSNGQEDSSIETIEVCYLDSDKLSEVINVRNSMASVLEEQEMEEVIEIKEEEFVFLTEQESTCQEEGGDSESINSLFHSKNSDRLLPPDVYQTEVVDCPEQYELSIDSSIDVVPNLERPKLSDSYLDYRNLDGLPLEDDQPAVIDISSYPEPYEVTIQSTLTDVPVENNPDNMPEVIQSSITCTEPREEKHPLINDNISLETLVSNPASNANSTQERKTNSDLESQDAEMVILDEIQILSKSDSFIEEHEINGNASLEKSPNYIPKLAMVSYSSELIEKPANEDPSAESRNSSPEPPQLRRYFSGEETAPVLHGLTEVSDHMTNEHSNWGGSSDAIHIVDKILKLLTDPTEDAHLSDVPNDGETSMGEIDSEKESSMKNISKELEPRHHIATENERYFSAEEAIKVDLKVNTMAEIVNNESNDCVSLQQTNSKLQMKLLTTAPDIADSVDDMLAAILGPDSNEMKKLSEDLDVRNKEKHLDPEKTKTLQLDSASKNLPCDDLSDSSAIIFSLSKEVECAVLEVCTEVDLQNPIKTETLQSDTSKTNLSCKISNTFLVSETKEVDMNCEGLPMPTELKHQHPNRSNYKQLDSPNNQLILPCELVSESSNLHPIKINDSYAPTVKVMADTKDLGVSSELETHVLEECISSRPISPKSKLCFIATTVSTTPNEHKSIMVFDADKIPTQDMDDEVSSEIPTHLTKATSQSGSISSNYEKNVLLKVFSSPKPVSQTIAETIYKSPGDCAIEQQSFGNRKSSSPILELSTLRKDSSQKVPGDVTLEIFLNIDCDDSTEKLCDSKIQSRGVQTSISSPLDQGPQNINEHSNVSINSELVSSDSVVRVSDKITDEQNVTKQLRETSVIVMAGSAKQHNNNTSRIFNPCINHELKQTNKESHRTASDITNSTHLLVDIEDNGSSNSKILNTDDQRKLNFEKTQTLNIPRLTKKTSDAPPKFGRRVNANAKFVERVRLLKERMPRKSKKSSVERVKRVSTDSLCEQIVTMSLTDKETAKISISKNSEEPGDIPIQTVVEPELEESVPETAKPKKGITEDQDLHLLASVCESSGQSPKTVQPEKNELLRQCWEMASADTPDPATNEVEYIPDENCNQVDNSEEPKSSSFRLVEHPIQGKQTEEEFSSHGDIMYEACRVVFSEDSASEEPSATMDYPNTGNQEEFSENFLSHHPPPHCVIIGSEENRMNTSQFPPKTTTTTASGRVITDQPSLGRRIFLYQPGVYGGNWSDRSRIYPQMPKNDIDFDGTAMAWSPQNSPGDGVAHWVVQPDSDFSPLVSPYSGSKESTHTYRNKEIEVNRLPETEPTLVRPLNSYNQSYYRKSTSSTHTAPAASESSWPGAREFTHPASYVASNHPQVYHHVDSTPYRAKHLYQGPLDPRYVHVPDWNSIPSHRSLREGDPAKRITEPAGSQPNMLWHPHYSSNRGLPVHEYNVQVANQLAFAQERATQYYGRPVTQSYLPTRRVHTQEGDSIHAKCISCPNELVDQDSIRARNQSYSSAPDVFIRENNVMSDSLNFGVDNVKHYASKRKQQSYSSTVVRREDNADLAKRIKFAQGNVIHVPGEHPNQRYSSSSSIITRAGKDDAPHVNFSSEHNREHGTHRQPRYPAGLVTSYGAHQLEEHLRFPREYVSLDLGRHKNYGTATSVVMQKDSAETSSHLSLDQDLIRPQASGLSSQGFSSFSGIITQKGDLEFNKRLPYSKEQAGQEFRTPTIPRSRTILTQDEEAKKDKHASTFAQERIRHTYPVTPHFPFAYHPQTRSLSAREIPADFAKPLPFAQNSGTQQEVRYLTMPYPAEQFLQVVDVASKHYQAIQDHTLRHSGRLQTGTSKAAEETTSNREVKSQPVNGEVSVPPGYSSVRLDLPIRTETPEISSRRSKNY